MKAADLSRYIKDPASMGPSTVQELRQLVKDFPYFQPAHLLLSLAARRWDAAVYQQTLRKTAIVVPNRSRFFEHISAIEEAKPEGKTDVIVNAAPVAEIPKTENDLVLLKAAEQVAEADEKSAVPPAEEQKDEQAEAALEKEIGVQVVRSFVEKEVLKTTTPPGGRLQKDPSSFGDWLAYMKKNNGQPYDEIEQEVKKEQAKRSDMQRVDSDAAEQDWKKKKQALIDQIIEKNPGHIRVREEPKFFSPEARARESLLESEHLVTETLARIYALQGSTAKAIRAYEILSLKNPQKSAYFAGLILKLKNNNKTS